MVAELKKGKYTYYHCTQNKGKCPGRTSVLEGEFDRQFIESLASIQMPDEAVDFVVKALKESHHDKMEYRDRVVSELESELKKLESRLDGIISTNWMAKSQLLTTIKTNVPIVVATE